MAKLLRAEAAAAPAGVPPSTAAVRAKIAQRLAEDLGKHGVSDGHLAAWLSQERAALATAADARKALSPRRPAKPVPKHRNLALQLALAVPAPTDLFGTPEERWFHVAQLLDLSGRDVEGACERTTLACLAAAWVMSAKFCGKAGPLAVTEALVAQLASCACALLAGGGGGGGCAVSAADVLREELSLAQALKCNVSSPTVHVWLRAFNLRFAAVTKGSLAKVQSAASSLQDQLAHQLVWSTRVCMENPPHPTAVGVFALTVAAVHPPAAERLRPPDMARGGWERLLGTVVIAGLRELGLPAADPQDHKPHAGMPYHDKVLAAAFEFATMCDAGSTRNAAWRVLEVLREALAPDLPTIASADLRGAACRHGA